MIPIPSHMQSGTFHQIHAQGSSPVPSTSELLAESETEVELLAKAIAELSAKLEMFVAPAGPEPGCVRREPMNISPLALRVSYLTQSIGALRMSVNSLISRVV